MADDGNRNRNPNNRRMDLNLYLGLPRRRPEPDIGSDLALNSLPVSAEMSSSHSESYPPAPQSTQIPIDRSNDPEYNPYSPSFDHVSSAVETLANEFFDDSYVHPPFLPSFVQASPTVQDSTEAVLNEGSNSNDAEYLPYSLSSYAPVSLSTPAPASESQTQPEIPHVPYIPITPTVGTHNGHHHSIESSLPEITGFSPYRADTPRRIPPDLDDPVRPLLLQYPEVRFRRLIDSNRRLLVRRLRATAPEAVDPDLDDFSPDVGGAFQERAVSETSNETNGGIQKTSVENLDAEELEETGSEDQNNGTANFDCNVCLDVAKEPVVTSCGHLFCWPCLYQWLHLHSDHKECPVCKGEVTESNITPIYGRGSSEMGVEKQGTEGDDSSLKIPPRPRGRRLEGFRQRIRRPLGAWRLIVDEDTQNQAEGHEETVQGIFNRANSRVLTRLLAARRFQRDDNSEHVMNDGGSGSSRNSDEAALNHTENSNSLAGVLHGDGSRSTPSALARRGIGFWPRFAFYNVPSSERLVAIASDISNVVGRMGNGGSYSNGSRNARDTNPLNVRGTSETAVAADQASASSTIAIIQGDNGVPASAEPSSSSRTLRRRRRNSVPGSLDVDGGVHHARKRRRLN